MGPCTSATSEHQALNKKALSKNIYLIDLTPYEE